LSGEWGPCWEYETLIRGIQNRAAQEGEIPVNIRMKRGKIVKKKG